MVWIWPEAAKTSASSFYSAPHPIADVGILAVKVCCRERFRMPARTRAATRTGAGVRKRSRQQTFEKIELMAAVPSIADVHDS